MSVVSVVEKNTIFSSQNTILDAQKFDNLIGCWKRSSQDTQVEISSIPFPVLQPITLKLPPVQVCD